MPITPLMPVYPRCGVRPVRGEGAYLWSEDGEKYLDFTAGIAVNILGHCHPLVVETIAQQAATLMHVSNLYGSPQGEAFAEKLVAKTFADTVFFTNSGTEAIDCAIKIARRYHYARGDTHRSRIISFSNAFHGRTLGAISASDQPKMREGFEPLLPGFTIVPFNDLAAVQAAMGPDVAAILLEPIQGEGGVTEASQEMMDGLAAIRDQTGTLLVFDEVQTGYCRTGTFFAYEQYGVTPDIMAVAKGIGAGFPLGACLASEEAAGGMTASTHGSTYGGNPLAMVLGATIFDAVTDEAFLANVRAMGDRLRQAIEQMIPNHDHVFESVRGRGLMLGLKLKGDVRGFMEHLREHHGLLTVSAGGNVLRLLPPLNIDESHIAECVERLSAGARDFVLSEAA